MNPLPCRRGVAVALLVWTALLASAAQGLVAVDDEYDALVDTQLVVTAPGVLANDTGLPSLQALATNGSSVSGSYVLNADGSFTYTPDLGFLGVDVFEYQIVDSMGPAASALVIITVREQPLPALSLPAVVSLTALLCGAGLLAARRFRASPAPGPHG